MVTRVVHFSSLTRVYFIYFHFWKNLLEQKVASCPLFNNNMFEQKETVEHVLVI